MRRVDEPVEPLAPGEPPRAFRWRGRRYVVQSVLTHWVETGAWWTAEPVPASVSGAVPGAVSGAVPDAVPDVERALWRVEAGARGTAVVGVLDLCLGPVTAADRASGWSVRHVYD